MQADRRLVQDVQDADEAAPDLGREPDPLGLATGERGRGARERQVVEADVDEELQTLSDLLQEPFRDHLLALAELDDSDEREGVADRQARELGDVPSAHRDRQAFRPQASAPARAARDLSHELLEPLALALGVGLDVASLDDRDHALVRRPVRARPSVPVLVPDVDLGVRAVEHDVPRSLREPPPWRRGREPVRLRHRVEDAVPVLDPPARPRRERALGDRQVRVGHDELGIDLEPRPEPVAGLARAVRRVEREVPRLQLVEREAVERARERLAVRLHVLAVVGLDRDRGEALGQAEGGLDRVGHPASDALLGDSRSTTTSIVCL